MQVIMRAGEKQLAQEQWVSMKKQCEQQWKAMSDIGRRVAPPERREEGSAQHDHDLQYRVQCNRFRIRAERQTEAGPVHAREVR
jgi:hypothetical protein